MVPVHPEETARVLLRRHAREARVRDPRRDALLDRIRVAVPETAPRFGASRVFLFGSLAWGGFHARSDVDLGVEGIQETDLDGFAADLMWKVDADIQVVAIETAPPGLRDRILRDGVLLYDAPRDSGWNPEGATGSTGTGKGT